ncbi:RNA-binding S4 domain-containing protein [Demequina lignilytica]|uniref:RNA-binding S4 domain-containing protein n=1 Tax=Demequina lignilytica TaxID=3051663 RepID=A0AAW7M7K1_9MICO|nr:MULTISPECIES: RNA-binding S4 domain-containing protein [unclassified Demequina]MDN4477759.1 RNA-binding S4 domain-containing protein [Demequina sp. SYSU T00039-1]MDN4483394.1 RNA-binding S4 domain-containing protein [Demequina sp. SYSU T0a273]MDN4487668.1 RNA-binding S4 domain-containing protein [Demequina sp. SYSU T00039]MDN4491379.1 RNA-binding S4 domain-containing protein [Demequina sp. SYSU T00068]
MAESVRVDAWTWAVRMYKSRSQATAAVKAGHVRVDGERAKPSTAVVPGATVEIRGLDRLRVLEVRQLLVKRVSAPLAQAAYLDHSPPPPPREKAGVFGVRERGAGRPTKKERRQLDRLRGRDGRG